MIDIIEPKVREGPEHPTNKEIPSRPRTWGLQKSREEKEKKEKMRGKLRKLFKAWANLTTTNEVIDQRDFLRTWGPFVDTKY